MDVDIDAVGGGLALPGLAAGQRLEQRGLADGAFSDEEEAGLVERLGIGQAA